ncbi:MAG: tetratricopeptide repeat protein [Deltaproteobacteria bacterium]|jgi:tetratricopeptide (TPR) repeat protein|nr:tetratricopeptide repeat protein [Deltaproteobacteria bacterium]
MEKHERITGIFSTQEVRKVGTGTTSRKTIHKSFWYCVEIESGENKDKVEIQPLNTNYVPSGPKRVLEKEQFLTDFSPEPEFYVSTVYPRMRDLDKKIARAERHRDNKEYYSAEMEFNNALKVDEENVRANFGLGLTYLERNEVDKAENIFNRLVKLEAAFEPEHKHLFNEFGIQLRKNRMYKESMEYYQRALELSSTDENIHYNVARVALESKDPAQAVSSLLKCLELNPVMEEGVLFLSWMKDKNMIPGGKTKEVEQALKKARLIQAGGAPPEAPQPLEEGP